jgi:glyoxylase-like metal-dependent hydrolase (beta-lactamase superfamily II)
MQSPRFQVYRSIPDGGEFLCKAVAWLPDRPGSLAELAQTFSGYGLNITHFHYNRAEHPGRTLVEAVAPDEAPIKAVRGALERMGIMASRSGASTPEEMELGVVEFSSLLSMEIKLAHKPGALAALAEVLKAHRANVTRMSYHEGVSPTSAQISLFTLDPAEVDALLGDLNVRGYHYSITYRGLDEQAQRAVDEVIGLNLAERFYFRMRKLLGTGDVSHLRGLVASSRKLTEALMSFSQAAGSQYEAGGVFTDVLAFASASIEKTGPAFTYTALPPVETRGMRLHVFRMPTGGNLALMEGPAESVLVDTGYGLYFGDACAMLNASGLDPERVRRVYCTHADADHAGMSAFWREAYGSRVYLHHAAREVLRHRNRAFGSATPVIELNHHFTVLVDEFTRSRVPPDWTEYDGRVIGHRGPFPVIDRFQVGPVEFEVLESLGGHVPGKVFMLSVDAGLLFTGDYLLNVESLGPEERRVLNYPKTMMTTTNVHSALFRREMGELAALARSLGPDLLIVPGHGDYYPARNLPPA